MGLKARIWAWRLKIWSGGLDFGLELGLRLEFGPGGWVLGLKARGGTEKKKEKFPLCESIGHRPIRKKK